MARPSKRDTGFHDTRVTAYLSPNDLAARWSCSRTTVQRIADRNRFTRYILGEGRNGIIRYARDEILAYETERGVSG